MDMANMLNVRLTDVGSILNCNMCGHVMNVCEGSPCITCNRISHESCMVVVPVGNQSAHVCTECLARYVDQRRERDHSQCLVDQVRRQVDWNSMGESNRNVGATIHSVTQGLGQMPLQFARGVFAGNGFAPLAQLQSVQQIQPGRDLLPESVGRPREGRRQQVMLQTPGAHQGQTQPAAASRAIEQGGVTRSMAEYDALRARMDRMQEEIQVLRQERDQARSFVQPRVASRTEDQGATAAQAASSSAQPPDDVDAVQTPVPSDGPILVDDQDEADGVLLLKKNAKVL